MINLTKDQIKEIAGQLDCGMRCYINKETGEIKTVLNFESWQRDHSLFSRDNLTEIQRKLTLRDR